MPSTEDGGNQNPGADISYREMVKSHLKNSPDLKKVDEQLQTVADREHSAESLSDWQRARENGRVEKVERSAIRQLADTLAKWDETIEQTRSINVQTQEVDAQLLQLAQTEQQLKEKQASLDERSQELAQRANELQWPEPEITQDKRIER